MALAGLGKLCPTRRVEAALISIWEVPVFAWVTYRMLRRTGHPRVDHLSLGLRVRKVSPAAVPATIWATR
jgi:hypothetical protein